MTISVTNDTRSRTADDLLTFYRMLQLIRTFEERVMQLRTRGEIVGPVHPYVGEEAIAVGVCQALTPDDAVVSNYRGHGHAIARGVALEPLTAELFGRATGLCGGKAAALISDPSTRLLMSSGIIGAGIPVAAGAAMASQLRGDGSVAVVFLGDGGLGSGVVHETLNLAAVQRLPLILVCEHNGYQGGTRTEAVYPDPSLLRIARAHHVHAVQVDGNDVERVAEVADEVVARARAGEGPSFVQADTYLTRFHLQFDVPSKERRPEAELQAWLARDPLVLVRERLAATGVDAATWGAVDEQCVRAVDRAVEAARLAPWPAATEVFTHVIAEAS